MDHFEYVANHMDELASDSSSSSTGAETDDDNENVCEFETGLGEDPNGGGTDVGNGLNGLGSTDVGSSEDEHAPDDGYDADEEN
jgi:hypothetical protein